jgi:hypothetical protein
MRERGLTYSEQELKNERRKSRHDAKVRLRMANRFEAKESEQSHLDGHLVKDDRG